MIEQTLESLERSLDYVRGRIKIGKVTLFLVDNGSSLENEAGGGELLSNRLGFDAVELLSKQGNVGYGRGHNLAIARATTDFHLILNPDVLLAEDALYEALHFMTTHPDVGLLAPAAVDGQGHIQYLCKRFPAVFDLLLRGFAPSFLQRTFRRRLERYEMRDLIGDAVVLDVPLVSGCFMLFRGDVLAEIRGFAPAYFLYFEDFDISLRAARIARIAYVPSVRITHFGGYAARKGWRHIGLFMRSAITFFHQQGWKWW